nr:MAG TPA: 60S ribosomal subunit [Caudoviricetes sp.]
MKSINAITQLEELKRDRLSFIQNDESDEIYLKDIKAISLAIKALKKCPDIQDKSFNCRMCGKELKTWKSIQKGFGPVCERKYLNDVYKNQQMSFENIVQKKGER